METTLAEFLMGMFAGTITGLLAILTKTTHKASHKFAKPQAQTNKRRKAKVRGARRNIPSNRTNTLRPRPAQIPPVQHTENPPPSAPTPVQIMASCPSCRLEAPESLMAEHFLGSPSHKNPQAHSGEEETVKTVKPSKIEDPQQSVRTLLQMLVPPRAFGHRRQEKTQNPLSDYLTPISRARKLSTNPLGDPF